MYRLKYLLLSVLASAGFLLFPMTVIAAVDVVGPACQDVGAGKPDICKDNQTGAGETDNPIFGPNGLVTKAVQVLSIVVGIASVVVIMVSGFRFITAGGNPENVTKARRGIIYAVVGLIITVAAQLIVNFVLSKV